mmetsp:Transcript_972/g.2643  ORF Transcript_972/g.2643 Transcript_972/m.2643 type:complete len:552 (-) Transcript_972:249-1904(-)
MSPTRAAARLFARRARLAPRHARRQLSAFPLSMTKVVCTLGPATETAEGVQALCDEGLSCARLNFSHVGDYSEPAAKLALVRAAKGEHARLEGSKDAAGSRFPNLRAVLLDTKGPEVRTGTLPGGVESFTIGDGMEVVCTFDDVSGDAAPADGAARVRLHVDYESLPQTVSPGSQILLDDGLISLRVTDVGTTSVTAIAENAGPIKARKGVNLPGSILDLPALTSKDKEDLAWAVQSGADYVALSFVRSAGNVRSCRAFLERCRATADDRVPLIISKIENQEGVDNFEEILAASDGIMVARGDLGVEIDYAKVFAAQRDMVNACNRTGKPVIVATQMLDSMMRQPRPTRAEVTDVAAAVLDGADAVMLSGETAAGKYPIEALKAMKHIVAEADAILDARRAHSPPRTAVDPLGDVELDAVALSACRAADSLDAKIITCITTSGSLARAIARHRPSRPVVAFCYSAEVGRQLTLLRAVTPILLDAGAAEMDPFRSDTSMGKLRAESIRTCRELGYVADGDRVVSVDRSTGKAHDAFALSNTLKVYTVSADGA